MMLCFKEQGRNKYALHGLSVKATLHSILRHQESDSYCGTGVSALDVPEIKTFA